MYHINMSSWSFILNCQSYLKLVLSKKHISIDNHWGSALRKDKHDEIYQRKKKGKGRVIFLFTSDRTCISFCPWTLLLLVYQTLGFPGSSVGKESTCNVGDPGWILVLGRSAGTGIGYTLQNSWAPLVAQLVNNLPSMQETWVWSLGWEDPLEKGKATHSSTLAWRFYGVYNPGGCRVWHHWATFTFTSDLSTWTGTMSSLSSTQASTVLALNHWPSYFPSFLLMDWLQKLFNYLSQVP